MRCIGLVLIAACVLSITGCGTDERTPVLDEAIGQLTTVTTKVRAVRTKVAEAVTKAEKKAKEDGSRPVRPADLDLAGATDAVKGLKEASKNFIIAARNAQNLGEGFTTQEQERYAELREKLRNALIAQEKERIELTKEVAKAQAINPTMTKELQKNLGEARAEFESVIKRS